mgnify:CR=1 FL=1|jgi:hypothetical protein
MIKKRSLLQILFVILSINFSNLMLAKQKSEPPIAHTIILSLVGGVGGFIFGVTQFINPEHYINLVPLISAPVCAITGALLVPFSYKQLYLSLTHKT